MILMPIGFSGNETTRQMKEELYVVLFRSPPFQKITILKSMLLMWPVSHINFSFHQAII